MYRHILIVFLSATLMACEDPSIRIDQLDPAIQGTFIDTDSLVVLDEMIDGINDNITLVNDSLAVIDSLEIAGDPTDYTEEIDALNSLLDDLQADRTELNTQRNEVSRGNILIDVITATGAPKEIIFTESQPTYRLPLDPAGNITQFEIRYNGEIHTALFSYSTDTVFINRTVRILAKNIILGRTSYDSARFSCDTLECSSINAKAIFYM